MSNAKKLLAMVLVVVLSVSMISTTNVSAAKKTKLNKKTVTIYVGKTVQLKLKNNKKKVKWTTSNKKIATVSKKGKVKGKKIGKATITAKVGKKKYKCKITVKKKKSTVIPNTKKPSEQVTTVPESTKASEEVTNVPETTKPSEEATTVPESTTNPDESSNLNYDEWSWDWWDENYDDIYICAYSGTSSNVIVPSSIDGHKVVEIGFDAFNENDNLHSIIIPDTISTISGGAFYNCVNLENIVIPTSVKKFGHRVFEGTKWLSEKQKNNPLVIVNNVLIDGSQCKGDISVPSTVTSISGDGFSENENITSIYIPESVSSIGIESFLGCSNLESVKIYGNIQAIESRTFTYCNNLKEVILPNSIISINYCAFDSCSKLENITLPNKLQTIDTYAFYGCSSLSKIDIPQSVTTIECGAFEDCTSLSNVSIPSSVTSINNPFENTPWLSEKRAENPLVIVNNTLIDAKNCKGTVTIPNTVNTIGASAFDFCENITDVTIPNSITKIGSFAFRSCSNLKEISIPEGVTKIEECTFSYCINLKTVHLPNSLLRIHDFAFEGCENIFCAKSTAAIFRSISVPLIIFGCLISSIISNNSLIWFTSATSFENNSGYNSLYSCHRLSNCTPSLFTKRTFPKRCFLNSL